MLTLDPEAGVEKIHGYAARVLTFVLAQALAAGPGFLGDSVANDTSPEVLSFTGASVGLTLKAPKHRVRLRDVLLDVPLEAGGHVLKEASPQQLPGPLLLVTCSKQNKVDGEVLVLGAAGVKLKGPKVFSVFALEPFVTRLPSRLHTIRDNGAGVLSAETTDLLQIADDYRYVRVIGLDPTARYKVSVAGKGPEQVIVVADREFPPTDDPLPADAAWSASRLVLKGGGSAELPATRQLALTLAGVDALIHGNSTDAQIEVKVEQVKAGTGALGPPRTVEVGEHSKTVTLTIAKQLLRKGNYDGARALAEQCVTLDPGDAECHLVYAKVWAEAGDMKSAVSQACLALRYAEGTALAAEARALLGDNKCP